MAANHELCVVCGDPHGGWGALSGDGELCGRCWERQSDDAYWATFTPDTRLGEPAQ